MSKFSGFLRPKSGLNVLHIGLTVLILVTMIIPYGAEAVMDSSGKRSGVFLNNLKMRQRQVDSLSPQILHSRQGESSIYMGRGESASTATIPSSVTQSYSEAQYDGYILELNTQPLVKLKIELDEERNRLTTQISQTQKARTVRKLERRLAQHNQSRQKKLNDRKRVIVNEQQNVISNLKRSVPSLAVGRKFSTVFNGFKIKVTDTEALSLSKLGYKIWPNYINEIDLSESVPLIGAGELWNTVDNNGLFVTGEGITIAILDTGVDYTHPDLGGCSVMGPDCKVAGGYDVINDDSDPIDDNGHGTHVASIAAGNGVFKGVAPDATIYAYKVLNEYGTGPDTVIIEAVERALDPNNDGDLSDAVDVINLSLGGGGTPDDPMATAVNNAMLAGTVVTISAGNSGPRESSIGNPGMAKEVITVGSSTKIAPDQGYFEEEVAFTSSRGPVYFDGKTFVKPDITAPGVAICAAQYSDYNEWASCLDDKHIAISGTSMASPHVAGAAALLRQLHPEWSTKEIKAAFKNTAVDLGATVIEQGSGRIDVQKAASIEGSPTIVTLRPISTEGVTREIEYTVQGLGGQIFLSYAPLDAGLNEESWTELFQESYTGGFKSGTLSFDTSKVASGDYAIRVLVERYNAQEVIERAVDYGYISVENVSIVSPLDADIIRAGDRIPVKIETVSGLRARVTGLEYGFGKEPSEWTKIRSRRYWSTRGFTTGWYTLRVTVAYGQITEQSTVNVYLDSTLKKGWPIRLSYEECINPWNPQYDCKLWGGYATPVVSDINGKGAKEVIVYVGGSPPKLYAFSATGKQLWVAEVGTGEIAGGNLHIPMVVDVDGDGKKEIFVINQFGDDFTSRLFVFDSKGRLLDDWSRIIPSSSISTMTAADLDRDGLYEIIIHTSGLEERVVILRSDGSLVTEIQLSRNSWSGAHESTPSVGNFDDDEELEIVIVRPSANAGSMWENDEFLGMNNEGEILVFNMDGTLVDGWPVYTPGIIFSTPAIGDLDGDNREDIVVGLMYATDIWPDYNLGGLIALNRDGDMLPGWPVNKGYEYWSAPSLGDLDNDGDLEVVASRIGFQTTAYEGDGTVMPGWPQFTGWNDYYSTIISDVDGDNKADILTTAGSAILNGGVYAWSASGNMLPGFPKMTEIDAQAPATVADIDNDGKVEVVASSDWDQELKSGKSKFRGSIYIWELEGEIDADTPNPWPTFNRDAERSGRYLGAEPAVWSAVPGDIVKTANSVTLSFVGYDGKRYVFPEDQVTYQSWYQRDPEVVIIPDGELSHYPFAGMAYVRPGTNLVKIETNPKIYAVSPGGVLHWIQTDEVGERLYGRNWKDRIAVLPDYVFVQYFIGEALTMSSPHPDGTVFAYAGSNRRYIVINGQRRKLTGRGVRENRIQSQYVIRGLNRVRFNYPDGDPVLGFEPALFTIAGPTL